MLDDILPVRRVFEPPQVGLELAAENFQSSALSNTVGTHKTQNISGSRHWQPMELKAVGSISMRDLALKVRGEVNDGDGTEWAAFRADAATDTELFRDEGNSRLGRHLGIRASESYARILAPFRPGARNQQPKVWQEPVISPYLNL